jgi:AdoMet-dependent heme synthase
VREDDVVQVYRDSPLFRELRDRSLLKGKCGVCEYREVCGGSRARAYALTGDPLEAEPYCAHVPARYAAMVKRGEAEPVEAYFARRTWHPAAPPPAQLVRGVRDRLAREHAARTGRS